MEIDLLSSPWDSSRSSSPCEEDLTMYEALTVTDLLPGTAESLSKQEEERQARQQKHPWRRAGLPQKDGARTDISPRHSQVITTLFDSERKLQAPRKKPASREEVQNPPFEDFTEALRDPDSRDVKSPEQALKNPRACVYHTSLAEYAQGDPLPSPKSAVTPAETTQEQNNLKAQPEAKTQSHLQHLSKSTQTEEPSQSPGFPSGGGNKNSLGFEKRNSPLLRGGAGRKWPEGSEAECEEELKELGWISYGFTTEPLYRKLDCSQGDGVDVRTVTEERDDHLMYSFDYGHRHCYRLKRDHEGAYTMKLAESSEKAIQENLREFFGFLRILVHAVTLFLVELARFLSKSVVQVLLVGLLTVVGDHMLKPFLVAVFNSILQPLLIFLLNVLCSIRNLTYPVIDILKGVCLQAGKKGERTRSSLAK
ncbi:hypothetical protein Y1Q_0018846 [Alligator mississippiensis]|uniref:Uncharacterized protein n=1 Tax=Alligator mississippiensis TaxID=8496 RepID=A0A151N534_ALLMI|nr:hypothetical protein Y1Q_0018846 [Alligator mississippiensis]